MRNFFVSFLILTLSSCAIFRPHEDPSEEMLFPELKDIKIYSIEPDDKRCPRFQAKGIGEPHAALWCDSRAGLYHFKDEQVINFSEASNFLAIEREDFDAIIWLMINLRAKADECKEILK